MLTLKECLGAYRPLTFVVAESDIEVLKYLENNSRKHNINVYSTTLADTIPLDVLLSRKFTSKTRSAQSTLDVLDSILKKEFEENNDRFETYVFLDCDNYIHDKQIIRKLKDIISRYQLDETFTVCIFCISQNISVPSNLERLSEVVFFDLPSAEELKKQSDELSEKLQLSGKKKPSSETISNLKGLTLFEVEQAYIQSFYLNKNIDPIFIRDFKKSAIAKTDLLSLSETNITFDDIGGMSTLKKWVQKSAGGWSVEGKKFGLPLLKGLLMVGLPGCGKSLISKAIGNEWKLPVIDFDPSRVFSSRVGDSEGNMRRILQIIEGISPCILFIDEIEKGLAGMQSSTFSDAGVTARVIGSFLVWMQECTKPIFTIATSNAIQYMPPELISRFDETFFVNLPQFVERCEIFRIHLKKLKQNPDKLNIEALATKSQDLSGREIEQALTESMYDAFHANKKELDTETIMSVLDRKTSLITTMAENLKYLLDWVGWDKDKKDGIRARFANPVEEDNMSRVKDQIDELCKEIEQQNPGKDSK